jgi:hypothetical protein
MDELEKRMSKLEQESNLLKLKADTLQQRISEIDIDKEARQLWIEAVKVASVDRANVLVDKFLEKFKK